MKAAIILSVAIFASFANASVICTNARNASDKLTLSLASLEASTGTLNYRGFVDEEASCQMKTESTNACEYASGDSSVVVLINTNTGTGAFSFSSNTDADGTNPVSSGKLTCN